MSVLVEILLFVYCSGFVGGLLCGLLAGFLAAFVWSRVRRRKRQVSAERFAHELNEWVEQIDEETQAQVIGGDKGEGS